MKTVVPFHWSFIATSALAMPTPAGHVRVVTAGMYDGHFIAQVVLGLHFASKRQPSDLTHGQCVEIGAHEDSLAWTVLQNGRHAPERLCRTP